MFRMTGFDNSDRLARLFLHFLLLWLSLSENVTSRSVLVVVVQTSFWIKQRFSDFLRSKVSGVMLFSVTTKFCGDQSVASGLLLLRNIVGCLNIFSKSSE